MGQTQKNPDTAWLNYHHLSRFWVIARSQTLSEAARELNVSQSTLSLQLRELEDSLGCTLFEREGRRLRLNAAGHVAYGHAETIFRSGRELLDNLRGGAPGALRVVRLGAVGSLSKNLQYDLLRPLLADPRQRVIVEAGGHHELLGRLGNHQLDVVLSHTAEAGQHTGQVQAHELCSMPVCLAGNWPGTLRQGAFPGNLRGVPLFLPVRGSQVRSDFDHLAEREDVPLNVRVEVEDMALLRLLALSGEGLALVPAIVVEHEIVGGLLRHVHPVRGLSKRFHALTLASRQPRPWLDELIQTFRRELRTSLSRLEELTKATHKARGRRKA